ncbi:MAG: outer membrane protein [Gemmatimonadaceae bacterium]
MTRKLLAVLAVGMLAAAPLALQAQSTSLVVAGGVAMPTGTMNNSTQSGYNAALGLGIGAPLIPVGVRLEAGLNGFNFKNNVAGDFRVVSGTANATFSLGAPYIIGGLGYYSARQKTTLVGGATSETTLNGMGLNAGAGLKFPLAMISPFVEVRYHMMLGDANKNVRFVPVTFGVSF